MGWLDPPNRRELTLLLFAVTIFTLSYNLDPSIQQFGLDPISKQGAWFSRLGLVGPSIIGQDGRRPPEWRDRLEKLVFGEWHWDEGHTAGDERVKVLGGDLFGALWHDRDKIYDVGTEEDGTMHDVLDWWGAAIPNTQLIKHVPGFTILDNVFLYNNSLFIVTDFPMRFHTLGDTGLSMRFVSPSNATEILGRFGGKFHGVTWLCSDTHPSNTTLMSLWRTYSSLDASIDSSGRTILPAPRRLIYPRVPVFSDQEPEHQGNITDEEFSAIPRRRADAGFHPFLPKLAFPSMGILYQADLDDYYQMEVPFVLPRVVFSTSESVANYSYPDQAFAFPELDVSPHWWEPIRRSVEGFFENNPRRRKSARVGVTYLHRQWDHTGVRVKTEDHNALIKALNKLQRELGIEVFIVSSLDQETSWYERMKSITRSQITLGVYGDHLLDAAFLQPSAQTTLIEFYPPGAFTHDRQIISKSLGIKYSAWWYNREMSSDSPSVQPPSYHEVSIDVQAVVQNIRSILTQPRLSTQ